MKPILHLALKTLQASSCRTNTTNKYAPSTVQPPKQNSNKGNTKLPTTKTVNSGNCRVMCHTLRLAIKMRERGHQPHTHSKQENKVSPNPKDISWSDEKASCEVATPAALEL